MWILLISIYSFHYSYSGNDVSVTSVPGFKTQTACESAAKAAQKWLVSRPDEYIVSTACVAAQ